MRNVYFTKHKTNTQSAASTDKQKSARESRGDSEKRILSLAARTAFYTHGNQPQAMNERDVDYTENDGKTANSRHRNHMSNV